MYIGRFAPTPSGPLHFGSLLAALASYLDAKANNGQWLVRMDDLDSPRCPPGAASHILKTLERFGFQWDGQVMYQSQRVDAYRDALEKLKQLDRVYTCTCSRKEVQAASTAWNVQGIYPQTCRHKKEHDKSKAQQGALRLKSEVGTILFNDEIQGSQQFLVERDVGDFVLFRADGFFAYHLAVVVDDFAQGVTHIVRGADLLPLTPHHVYLQSLLRCPVPVYSHIPVVVNQHGEKLSKQTLAAAIEPADAYKLVSNALIFLGQNVELQKMQTVEDLLQSAVKNWSLTAIPKVLFKAVADSSTLVAQALNEDCGT